MNTPIKLGSLELKNRFVVAPLTRMRGDPKTGVPNDLMAEYYSQRSSFGLIITEGSQIDMASNTFPGAGGIHTQDQIQGWKKVVDRVHSQGGKIMIQIYHGGRSAKLQFTGGKKVVSSTDVPISTPGSDIPHRLTIPEIKEVIEQYRQAAVNAKLAGFDGVQFHAANGYLADQFLRDSANDRDDEYGGSIENRSRFALEGLDALISVYGSDKTSFRLSPTDNFQDMFDTNPLELCKYLFIELEKRKLAFVELRRHSDRLKDFKPKGLNVTLEEQIPDFFKTLRKYYSGNIVANDGIDIPEAENLIKDNIAQAIAFGRFSISNPDLPSRVANKWPINTESNQDTWYTGGKKGYTDYEFYKPSS